MMDGRGAWRGGGDVERPGHNEKLWRLELRLRQAGSVRVRDKGWGGRGLVVMCGALEEEEEEEARGGDYSYAIANGVVAGVVVGNWGKTVERGGWAGGGLGVLHERLRIVLACMC